METAETTTTLEAGGVGTATPARPHHQGHRYASAHPTQAPHSFGFAQCNGQDEPQNFECTAVFQVKNMDGDAATLLIHCSYAASTYFHTAGTQAFVECIDKIFLEED